MAISTYQAGRFFLNSDDASALRPLLPEGQLQPARYDDSQGTGCFTMIDDDRGTEYAEWWAVSPLGALQITDGLLQEKLLHGASSSFVASEARCRRLRWTAVFRCVAQRCGVYATKQQRDLILAGDPAAILKFTRFIIVSGVAKRPESDQSIRGRKQSDSGAQTPLSPDTTVDISPSPYRNNATDTTADALTNSSSSTVLGLYRFLNPMVTMTVYQAMALQQVIAETSSLMAHSDLGQQRLAVYLRHITREKIPALLRAEEYDRLLIVNECKLHFGHMNLVIESQLKSSMSLPQQQQQRNATTPEVPVVETAPNVQSPFPVASIEAARPTQSTASVAVGPEPTPKFSVAVPDFRVYLAARCGGWGGVPRHLQQRYAPRRHDEIESLVRRPSLNPVLLNAIRRPPKGHVPSMSDFPAVPFTYVIDLLVSELRRGAVPPQQSALRRLRAGKLIVAFTSSWFCAAARRQRQVHPHSLMIVGCERCSPIIEMLTRRLGATSRDAATTTCARQLIVKYSHLLCEACRGIVRGETFVDDVASFHHISAVVHAFILYRASLRAVQQKHRDATSMRFVCAVACLKRWVRRRRRPPAELDVGPAVENLLSKVCHRDEPIARMLVRRLQRRTTITNMESYSKLCCYACRIVFIPAIAHRVSMWRVAALSIQAFWRWISRRRRRLKSAAHSSQPPPPLCRCAVILEWVYKRRCSVTRRNIQTAARFVCRSSHVCLVRFSDWLTGIVQLWRGGQLIADRYRWLLLRRTHLSDPVSRLHDVRLGRRFVTLATPGVCRACYPITENLFRRLAWNFSVLRLPPQRLDVWRFTDRCCADCVEALHFTLAEWTQRQSAARRVQVWYRSAVRKIASTTYYKSCPRLYIGGRSARCGHRLCESEMLSLVFLGLPLTRNHRVVCLTTYITYQQAVSRMQIVRDALRGLRRLCVRFYSLSERVSHPRCVTTIAVWWRYHRRLRAQLAASIARAVLDGRFSLDWPAIDSAVKKRNYVAANQAFIENQRRRCGVLCHIAFASYQRQLLRLSGASVSFFPGSDLLHMGIEKTRALRRLCCVTCRVKLTILHYANLTKHTAALFIRDRLHWLWYWNRTHQGPSKLRFYSALINRGGCIACRPWRLALVTRQQYEMSLFTGSGNMDVPSFTLKDVVEKRRAFEQACEDIETSRRARRLIALISEQRLTKYGGAQRFTAYLSRACPACKPSWVKSIKAHCIRINKAASEAGCEKNGE